MSPSPPPGRFRFPTTAGIGAQKNLLPPFSETATLQHYDFTGESVSPNQPSSSYHLKGDAIDVKNGLIGFRTQANAPYQYYRPDQFKEVCEKEKSAGMTTGLIVGIILGALALVGVSVGVGVATYKESKE